MEIKRIFTRNVFHLTSFLKCLFFFNSEILVRDEQMTNEYKHKSYSVTPKQRLTFKLKPHAKRKCKSVSECLIQMLRLNFILGLNYIFLCFEFIMRHYHIQKQKPFNFKPRTKLNDQLRFESKDSQPCNFNTLQC